MSGRRALAAASVALASIVSCRGTAPDEAGVVGARAPGEVGLARAEDAGREELQGAEREAIEATIVELYRAFGFRPGEGADWDRIRASCIEGASFLAPVREGEAPSAVGIDGFLRAFEAWAASEPVRSTGLEERVLYARIEGWGTIALAWVAFEGYVPATGERRTRGVDSIGFVRDGTRWKVGSFSTQYEDEQSPLPGRFLANPAPAQ